MPLLNNRNLDGREIALLSDALRDAFRNPPQLDMMLGQGMNANLANYVPSYTEYDVAVFNLIVNLQAEGRTADLLVAARLAKPGNVKLLKFAQAFGLAPTEAAADFLEKTIKPKLPYLDLQVFIQRLGEVEGRVGRVEVVSERGTLYGTGFLVNADVVVTNYHVIESALDAGGGGECVTVRFDYKVMSDGTRLFPGTPYRLAGGADWLVDSSPYSRVDSEPDPKSGEPAADELDYAFLRLADRAGDDPVGGSLFAGAGGSRRGWVATGQGGRDEDYQANRPLFIVEHPDGAPLKLAPDTEGMIGLNGNGTRVRYKNNTEGGSSGSPCFSADFRLVALHHSGDPRTKGSAQFNEGIPFRGIRSLLEKRGKEGCLG
jgi:hypothetical protein